MEGRLYLTDQSVQHTVARRRWLINAAPDDIIGVFFDEMEEMTSKSLQKWTGPFGDFELIIERVFVFDKPGVRE